MKNSVTSPLHGFNGNRLSVIKTEVSKEPPPDFLVGSPLGHPLENPHKKPILSSVQPVKKPKQRSSQRMIRSWLLEELSFSMNKMSLAGLVFGLMVLGTLFFVIGFLAAVATFGTGKTTTHSWTDASMQHHQQAQGKPGIFGKLAGRFIQEEAIKVESKLGGGVIGGVIAKHVPAPLQPFAQHAQNKIAMTSQQAVNRVANVAIGNTNQPYMTTHPQNTPGAVSPFAPQPRVMAPAPYIPSPNYQQPRPMQPGSQPPPPGYQQPQGMNYPAPQ
jgi:hypothetical protein